MPLRTRRSFTRGTPRGLLGSIGLMAAHSSSVGSYRMIRPLDHRLESRLGGQAQLGAPRRGLVRYPPETRRIMLIWSFGVHDPRRTWAAARLSPLPTLG